MPASEAQIAANRKNAFKSCGPKTPEGKERSRGNALKHGLTGAGVVLPVDDADEVERRLAAFEDELKPSGEVGRALVRRAAILSVRLDRCVSHESASLADRVRRAELEFVAPEGLDAAEVARLRAEAGRRALFDSSKEATLARKYEAAAERGFFRALKELRQVERASKATPSRVDRATFAEGLGSSLSMSAMEAEFDEMYAAFEAEDRKPADLATLRSGTAAFLDKIAGGGVSNPLPFSIGRPR